MACNTNWGEDSDLCLERVSLDRIDIGNQRYRISSQLPLKPLIRSLNAMGTLTPPVLLADGTNGFIVVSGFRRLEALAHLKVQEVIARVLPAETSHCRCAMMAVGENSLQRTLNPMETARSLALLTAQGENSRIPAEQLRYLGLDVHPSQIEKLLALNNLPQKTRDAVEAETIAPVMALELGRLEEAETICLTRLFADLKPSLGKQRELLSLLREIALRDQMTIAAVLESIPVRAVLEAETDDRNAKTARFRQVLKQLRFPSLSQAEIDFETARKALKLPGNIQLLPSKGFESQVYQFVLSLTSLQDLEEHRNTLTRLLDEPALAKIFQR